MNIEGNFPTLNYKEKINEKNQIHLKLYMIYPLRQGLQIRIVESVDLESGRAIHFTEL